MPNWRLLDLQDIFSKVSLPDESFGGVGLESPFLKRKREKEQNQAGLCHLFASETFCTHYVNVVFRIFSKYGIFTSFGNKSNYHLGKALDFLLSWTVWTKVAFLIFTSILYDFF